MFSRMKQKVKEKTGRARATSLPEDVEASMTYFKGLGSRVKDMHKSLNDLNDVFKWQTKAKFADPINNFGRLGDKVDMAPFSDAVTARINAEEETQKGLAPEVDKLKAYVQNECKMHNEAISVLNRSRLDMDVANGNYSNNETDANRMRAEAATKAFEDACQKMRELWGSVSALETSHSQWVEAIANQMKLIFKK